MNTWKMVCSQETYVQYFHKHRDYLRNSVWSQETYVHDFPHLNTLQDRIG